MFLLLISAYLFAVDNMDGWQMGFVLVAMVVFTINHFICTSRFGIICFYPAMALDFLVASLFGFVFPGYESLFLVFFGVIAVSLFLGTDNRRALLIFGVLFLLVWAGAEWNTYFQTGDVKWVSSFISFAFVIHGCLVGALIRHLQLARLKISDQYVEVANAHKALQDAHEQLRSYAAQVEQLTVTRERNHIAREIHDGVGHSMTALLVQLQAARMLADHDLEKSKQTIARCEELARCALQEIRLSVRTLHEEGAVQVTLGESLRKLMADFSQMTGLETSLQVQGDLSYITTSLQPTIYRVVQECLTNAKRHGNATQAEVNIRVSEQQVEMDIADNGLGTAEVVPGFGLIRMRDRITEQGGTVRFCSEKGAGFSVMVTFPLQQQIWRYGGVQA
ncbi:histidine kinase [Effusibacillus lacus]|uniref:histidine kinase n=2 Tax=Effusibacillus lacus TaxID=1348429 RepID=A0A292YR74_9BACL|nr:histidine kinase [Effusibacillus lacus]